MWTLVADTKECLIYPGEYKPFPETRQILDDLISAGKESSSSPVNMDEFENYFKVEMVVPGASREEILVYVHENILSILVLHKDVDSPGRKLKIHEFDTDCIERHVMLPENTDSEFACAVYWQGLLVIHIPKTAFPSKSVSQQIIVY